MKHKFTVAITFIILILIVLLSIFAFSKVKEVKIDLAFYLLIICILLVFSFFNQESFLLKVYQIILTFLLVIMSFVSFYFSIFLSDILTKVFKIDENISRIFYSVDNEFAAVYVNNTFVSVALMLVLSYFVYSVFIKLMKKIAGTLNSEKIVDFYKKSSKSITAYLTVLLVIFGFLPLFIGLVDFENNIFIDSQDIKEIIENFNTVIFGAFITLIIPYAYLLIQESKSNMEIAPNRKIKILKRSEGFRLYEEKRGKVVTKKTKSENLALHLKYCIVIFLVLTCIVGGLALYNQKLAIAGLSNAGLLLSIVLAVIAILITLWDVAGQRNSIGKVEKSVDDLKVVTAGLEEIVSNALLTIEGKQNELSEVTKILVDKTEILNSATTGTDQTFEELKNQLTIIQKGLNRSEFNKNGIPRDRNVRALLEQLNYNESSTTQNYRNTIKELYDSLNVDK